MASGSWKGSGGGWKIGRWSGNGAKRAGKADGRADGKEDEKGGRWRSKVKAKGKWGLGCGKSGLIWWESWPVGDCWEAGGGVGIDYSSVMKDGSV